jgi:hypothetical protein
MTNLSNFSPVFIHISWSRAHRDSDRRLKPTLQSPWVGGRHVDTNVDAARLGACATGAGGRLQRPLIRTTNGY